MPRSRRLVRPDSPLACTELSAAEGCTTGEGGARSLHCRHCVMMSLQGGWVGRWVVWNGNAAGRAASSSSLCTLGVHDHARRSTLINQSATIAASLLSLPDMRMPGKRARTGRPRRGAGRK